MRWRVHLCRDTAVAAAADDDDVDGGPGDDCWLPQARWSAGLFHHFRTYTLPVSTSTTLLMHLRRAVDVGCVSATLGQQMWVSTLGERGSPLYVLEKEAVAAVHRGERKPS